MTKVKVVASSDGKTKREINLDGFEEFIRKMEGDIRCDVCQKPVRKGKFYMGMFASGHKKCVEREDKRVFEEAEAALENDDEDFEDLDDENWVDEEEPGFGDDE